MNIICPRETLNAAVTPALYAVSSKNTNIAIEGFLLVADKESGTLTVCGYDLEKGIKVTLFGEHVQIKKSGKIIINAGKFSSIIRNLPEGDVFISADDNFVVTVTGGRSEFTVHGLDGEAFPLLPELKGEKSFKISQKTLKNMIVSTHFAIGMNNSRPDLNGALFEIKDNAINIVGVDGNRLAICRSFDGVITEDSLDLSFIVPGKSLSELLKLIGDGDEEVEIELSRKHVIIFFENIIYFSRLIESEFLDYRRPLGIDPKTSVVIDVKAFAESVERASLITDDKQKTLVKLKFEKAGTNIENRDDFGTLQITSATTIGKACDECDIVMYGEEIEIGFNHRYLLDALKTIRDEKVLLKLENPTKSMVIMPYSGDNKDEGESVDVTAYTSEEINGARYLYLVLPVRMRE